MEPSPEKYYVCKSVSKILPLPQQWFECNDNNDDGDGDDDNDDDDDDDDDDGGGGGNATDSNTVCIVKTTKFTSLRTIYHYPDDYWQRFWYSP